MGAFRQVFLPAFLLILAAGFVGVGLMEEPAGFGAGVAACGLVASAAQFLREW